MPEVRPATLVDEPKKAGIDSEEAPESGVKGKKSKLPVPITATLIPEDFYAYVAALTRQDWAHVAIYVYRLNNPRIIRDPSNVDCIDREPPSVPFTEQYLKETQGSGKFEVKLNDTDARRTVCRMLTDINDPEYPPVFDIRELDVGFKGNRLIVERLKREGKLSQDGEVIVQKDADATTANALRDVALEAMRGSRKGDGQGLEGQAVSKAMDMIANASNKSIEIALSQLKNNDKGDSPMLTMILTFMMKQLELAEKRSAAPSGDSQTLVILMKMLDASEKRAELADARAVADRKEAAEERQRQHELQLKQMELQATKGTAAGSLKEMAETMQIMAEIRETVAADAPAKRPGWPGLLEEHSEELLGVARYAIDKMTAGGYQRGAQPGQQQPGQRPVNDSPISTEPPRPSNVQPINQESSNVPQPNQNTPQLDPEIAWLLYELCDDEAKGHRGVGPVVASAFKNDPLGGADAAMGVSLFKGKGYYERICNIGRPRIVEAVKTLIPQMWADLMSGGSEEMVATFLDDFIAGPDAGEPEPEEVKPAPVAVPKKGGKK